MSRSSLRPGSLAISNLAWPAAEDNAALALAAELGFDGIELAPAKVFGDLHSVAPDRIAAYRRHLAGMGLAVPALQGLLFGAPGAHLFTDSESRESMAVHLRRVAAIAGDLGAGACVFGAPALRDPGPLAPDDAHRIAVDFLRDLAPHFAAAGSSLCFEANPARYGCRFVMRTQEAFALVEAVDAAGIALQLDTGTMFVNGEDPAVIGRVAHRIGHLHVSEPDLAPVASSGVDHAPVAAALGASGYSGFVSIEMKCLPDWSAAIRQAHAFVEHVYGRARASGGDA